MSRAYTAQTRYIAQRYSSSTGRHRGSINAGERLDSISAMADRQTPWQDTLNRFSTASQCGMNLNLHRKSKANAADQAI